MCHKVFYDHNLFISTRIIPGWSLTLWPGQGVPSFMVQQTSSGTFCTIATNSLMQTLYSSYSLCMKPFIEGNFRYHSFIVLYWQITTYKRGWEIYYSFWKLSFHTYTVWICYANGTLGFSVMAKATLSIEGLFYFPYFIYVLCFVHNLDSHFFSFFFKLIIFAHTL